MMTKGTNKCIVEKVFFRKEGEKYFRMLYQSIDILGEIFFVGSHLNWLKVRPKAAHEDIELMKILSWYVYLRISSWILRNFRMLRQLIDVVGEKMFCRFTCQSIESPTESSVWRYRVDERNRVDMSTSNIELANYNLETRNLIEKSTLG